MSLDSLRDCHIQFTTDDKAKTPLIASTQLYLACVTESFFVNNSVYPGTTCACMVFMDDNIPRYY